MIFNDDFFDDLPSDKLEVGIRICNTIKAFDAKLPDLGAKFQAYSEYLDALGALTALVEAYDYNFIPPTLGSDKHDNIRSINMFALQILYSLEAQLANSNLGNSLDRYKKKLANIFSYKFTDGDLKQIQSLLNELRNLITESELFNSKHKERILNRLENLQKELHKTMSSLDKFWGLLGEAGIVLGKFGQDAKPIFDIIKTITDIVWRTQVSSEELPTGTTLPMLKM
jgi:hypothetical protein